ncbi:M48 family metalloprotease, partial [Candidatus Micrarchaeota archaeon]|nr:M48 family metalloprotease [Candidatus Micrarchaeota archaeon]
MEKLNLFDAIDANKRNSIILLVFVFLLLVMVGWAFSYVLGLGDFGFLITIFIVLIYMFIMYFIGDWAVLGMSGAKPATREGYPYLHHIVEGMAIAANIPVPKIYVVDDLSPNAFAVGRDPKHASVAVTTGLLNKLNKEEL